MPFKFSAPPSQCSFFSVLLCLSAPPFQCPSVSGPLLLVVHIRLSSSSISVLLRLSASAHLVPLVLKALPPQCPSLLLPIRLSVFSSSPSSQCSSYCSSLIVPLHLSAPAPQCPLPLSASSIQCLLAMCGSAAVRSVRPQ